MKADEFQIKANGNVEASISLSKVIEGLSDGNYDLQVDALLNGVVQTSSPVVNFDKVSSVTYEAETIAYMDAIGIPDNNSASIYGITNNAVWVAVDNYFKAVSGFKSKLLAVYPMIGGTATAHKFNAYNPLDTNAAFRITWSGGTHSATGWQGDGSSYGDTNFNQSTDSILDDESFGVYSRTDTEGAYVDIGLWEPGTGASYILANISGDFILRSQNETSETIAVANSLGYFSGSRFGSTVRQQKNDTIVTQTRASTSLANRTFYIGGRNHPTSMLFSNRQYSYAFIGRGLTESEMLTNRTAVQQLQTALNRQV